MTIEVIPGGGVVVTDADIPVYRLLSMRAALKLDTAGTGMKFSNRVNIRKLCKAELVRAGREAPRNGLKLYEAFAAYVKEVTGR